MIKRFSTSFPRATHHLRKLMQFLPFRRVNTDLEEQVARLKEDNARKQGKIEKWKAYDINFSVKQQEWHKAWWDERNSRKELIESLLIGSGYEEEGWPILDQDRAELQEPNVLLAMVRYLAALGTFESLKKWHTDRKSTECAAFVVGVRAYEVVHCTHGSDEDKKAFLSKVIDRLAAGSDYAKFSHSGLETRFNADRHIRTEIGWGDRVTPLSFLVCDRNSGHIIFKAWVK